MNYYIICFPALIISNESSEMKKMCLRVVLAKLFLLTTVSSFCYHKYTIIKHPSNGLLLDASEQTRLRIKNATHHPAQLWKLEPRCDGTFLIINGKNGCVLSIAGETRRGNNVTISEPRNHVKQQWFINSDGSIVNAGEGKLALDVIENNYVVVETKDNSRSQLFQLSCVCCPYCLFMFRTCC